MDTITRADTLQGLTLDASAALDLLTGAAIAAHSKADLPALNCVNVSAGAGTLTAVATDRFRLIYGEIKLEGESESEGASLDPISIPLADIKRITAAIKALPKAALSRATVSLNRAGDILTVTINAGEGGTNLVINLYTGQQFPPYKQLFNGEPVPVSELQLNADYLAAFAKVPTSGGGQQFTFTGDRKPIKVKINHDLIAWHGLLMPMRTI
jgi:DNA polymerase III sliding clamp (beta) subunit (PCNA family)